MERFLTRYTATIIIGVNLLLWRFPKNKILQNLSTLTFGLAWGIGVTGFVVNRFYGHDIREKYSLSTEFQLMSDIIGHLLPIILAMALAPRKTKISTFWLLLFPFAVVGMYLFFVDPIDHYVGVPLWILFILFPVVTVIATLIRYNL